DDPAIAIFWPFADYSPEYQAVCWAARNDVPVRLIDLPASWQLAEIIRRNAEAEEEAGPPAPETLEDFRRDPLGVLARAGGYEDGESWWRDVIEENPSPGPVFGAIADAMQLLRSEAAGPAGPVEQADDDRNELREAHMRVQIEAVRKENEGPVAVICGAWHVPALHERKTLTADRGLLKGQPKTKSSMTWAPWTSARLAFGSGYGAGVTAPGWCQHLWSTTDESSASVWLARIAAALRHHGHIVSTASLIEAERLAHSLACLRERPRIGFEELTEAAVACLCFGERLRWEVVAADLLIGTEVGEIPDEVPLAPLLEDLQRQQRSARLKPEALERELSLDLRSDAGLFRSTLLHRLVALDVPWGRLTDSGRSRGTFRERWKLQWDPEFSVKLVEHLVYGSTVEAAAGGRLAARIKEEAQLGPLAELVLAAITAKLPDAAREGIARLQTRAAHTSDCLELLAALPPLSGIVRYGEARGGGQEDLTALTSQIAVQAALALPYAARGLDSDAGRSLCEKLRAGDQAINLVELSGDELQTWQGSLETLIADARATRLVSGAAARLLYDADELGADVTAQLFGRMLSPGTPVLDAAAFFEGFFEGAGQLLLFDEGLRSCVNDWVASLDGETFIEYLPLFRRVFGGLDRAERKRLLDELLGTSAPGVTGLEPAADGGEAWRRHFEILSDLLTREPNNGDA
ncbi:MAG: DUF5682 family protein, partial [Pseudomonadota bacterium]